MTVLCFVTWLHIKINIGNPLQSITIHFNTIQCNTLHCTTLHYTTIHNNTLHYTTIHYTSSLSCSSLSSASPTLHFYLIILLFISLLLPSYKNSSFSSFLFLLQHLHVQLLLKLNIISIVFLCYNLFCTFIIFLFLFFLCTIKF